MYARSCTSGDLLSWLRQRQQDFLISPSVFRKLISEVERRQLTGAEFNSLLQNQRLHELDDQMKILTTTRVRKIFEEDFVDAKETVTT